VTQDSSWYGNIAVNDSALGNPYYSINVSQNVPGGYTFMLDFKFRCATGDTSTSSKEFTVYAPRMVYESYAIQDQNSNGIWDPGETVNITVTLRNDGNEDANSITGTLRSTSSYVTINDSVASFGNCSVGGTTNNSSNPFVAVSASGTPPGHQAQFIIHSVTQEGYVSEDTFTISIGSPGTGWVDHDCGNILLTVTKWGSIGYLSSAQTAGNGCQYPIGASNALYYGGFAIGTALPYVIDRYYESNSSDDDDWVTVDSVHMIEPSTPFDEYSFGLYNDSGGEQVKGIECFQKGYAWSDPNADDFVILEFILRNKGTQDVTGLYAGIFLDWDIGSYTSNLGGTDASRSLAYVYYSSTYVGSAILNPMRNDPAIANISMINNPTYVWPYGGLPDSVEIKFLDGTYSFPSAGSADDWSTCVSAGPFDIPVGDSATVAFAIAGGTNLSNLQEHVDTAYNRYWQVNVKEAQVPPSKKPISIKTNIIRDGKLNFSLALPSASKVKIEIYNPAGQKVKQVNLGKVRNLENSLNLKKLGEGVYFLNIKTEKQIFRTKILLLR
jgi:hypothetical protein